MVEYALLVALLAVIAIGAMRYFGGAVADLFCTAAQTHYNPATKQCEAGNPDP